MRRIRPRPSSGIGWPLEKKTSQSIQPVRSAHGKTRNVLASGTSTTSGKPVNSSMPNPAPRREGWHEHLVAGVKTVDRPGEVEAVRQGGDRHLRRKCLAPRNAVLIDDGQADGAQVKIAYPARNRISRRGLLGRVQTM